MAAWVGGLPSLFSEKYLPYKFCYLAQPGLIWTNVATDGLIAAAYAAIFGCLMWVAARLKGRAEFRSYLWIFVSFGMFILACAGTHAMEVVTVWWPFYPLSAGVKVVCAVASVGAAVLFGRATPKLATNLGHFLEMLSATERERDRAVSALERCETLVEERQRTANEIATVSAQLHSVLECTSDMVMTLGFDWTVVYANGRALRAMCDLKVGKSYWECFPSASGTMIEEHLRETMEGRRGTNWESFYEGYGRWFRVQAYPSQEGVSIFFSDTTERQALKEQLGEEQQTREKRVEALSHMAGGLAHEISNPLAIIHARASDLKALTAMGAALPAPLVQEACESIVNTSDRAIRILKGLRALGREASQDPRDWASIYDIIQQAVEMQVSRYERHEVKLTVEVEENLPLLLCRETQIGQIVTNLLNNAFDSIDQGQSTERWVRLGAKSCEGDICVEVSDSGPGVPEEIRTRLMEPFFTTKKMGLGMGVGLSLSRAIAKDHGGSLDLCSGTEHTCFSLKLPLGSDPSIR
jgi:C4-dicarboxylate-specific signal transduction histidine kinase